MSLESETIDFAIYILCVCVSVRFPVGLIRPIILHATIQYVA